MTSRSGAASHIGALTCLLIFSFAGQLQAGICVDVLLEKSKAQVAIEKMINIANSNSQNARSTRAQLMALQYLQEMRVTTTDFTKLSQMLRRSKPQSSTEVLTILAQVFPAIARGDKKIQLEKLSLYDFEVQHSAVRNQNAYYSCWAMASTCVAEMNQGQGARLSHSFLYRNYLRSRLFELLDDPAIQQIDWRSDYDFHYETTPSEFDPRQTLKEVGEFWKAVGFANQFGMIPDHVWTTQRAFDAPMNRVRLLAAVKVVVNDYKSARTDRQTTVAKLNVVLDQFFGVPPSKDTIDKHTIPMMTGDNKVVRTVVDTAWDRRDEEYAMGGVEHMRIYNEVGQPLDMTVPVDIDTAPLDSIINFITKNIRRSTENPDSKGNNAFFISYNLPGEDPNVINDEKNGLLDVKNEQGRTPMYKLRHAIVVVGYETDFYGRVIALKLLNSYGPKVGKKGIFHMTDRFFKRYLFDVVFIGHFIGSP